MDILPKAQRQPSIKHSFTTTPTANEDGKMEEEEGRRGGGRLKK